MNEQITCPRCNGTGKIERGLGVYGWSDKDDAFLVHNWYGKMSRAEIARALGRTRGACYARAKRLGLR